MSNSNTSIWIYN